MRENARNSQPEYRVSPGLGVRQEAALTAGDRNGTHSRRDGLDHLSGLLTLLQPRNLAGSEYDADREWHVHALRTACTVQAGQAPLTQTRSDPTMPVGSTSKTWDPRADHKFLAPTTKR